MKSDFARNIPRLGLNRMEVALAIGVAPNTVDQMVKENLSFFQDSSVDREEHDTLFYLKSLDLDMRMHYKLGTIYACGREHRACA